MTGQAQSSSRVRNAGANSGSGPLSRSGEAYPILGDAWARFTLRAMAAPSLVVVDTAEFRRWLRSLRDARARARILRTIDHLSLGHFGNAKSVGGGISELRVDYGPGYRIYFARRGERLILLAYGGDKSGQKNDIARARRIAASWEPENGD